MKILAAQSRLVSCSLHTHRHDPPPHQSIGYLISDDLTCWLPRNPPEAAAIKKKHIALLKFVLIKLIVYQQFSSNIHSIFGVKDNSLSV
eukprot:CCRYP_016746-RA/>CCRYP_016746-RA protein AED:0.42 eAED:0.42 QI:20/1/0.5/1/0/0.5/2/0/88